MVLQPGYLPWLGFFDQMLRADIFVCYDDVQFDKNGWRNRNRIKTDRGSQWLTVPILHKGRAGQRICDVEIDNRTDWARKHVATITQAYAKVPHRDAYLPELGGLLSSRWTNLVELDMAVIEMMVGWFGIVTPVYRSSRLGIDGDQSGRLVAICRYFGADRYLSGQAAKAYLDEALFERAGIAVAWQDYRYPTYPQLHGPFVPYLSALDLVLNAGPDSGGILRAGEPSGAVET